MANRPGPRNWKDVQMMFAAASMALTLALWNLFAGPDRETAEKRAQEQVAPPPQPTEAAQPVVQATPEIPSGPIYLGGSAPQTQVIIKTGGGGGGGNGGGGNGGGGGGSGPVTSTSSS